MKNLKQLFIVLMVLFTSILSYAQIDSDKVLVTDSRSFWHFTLNSGYDFPNYSFKNKETPDMRYIGHKGTMMGSMNLEVGYYWDWFGVIGNFSYIQNKPFSKNLPEKYMDGRGGIYDISYTEKLKKINRLFYGVGPSFKYQSQNNKFISELNLFMGLGSVKGGEMLVNGKYTKEAREFKLNNPVAYHSGFNDKNLFVGKAQVRLNYFFNDFIGAHVGVYYMHYFTGIKENTENDMIKEEYPKFPSDGVYSIEQNTQDVKGIEVLTSKYSARADNEKEYQGQAWNLNSYGVFAGVSLKIPTKIRPIKDPFIEEKAKYNLSIVAKDKYTNQVLADTDVVLKNNQNVVVKSGKTNSFGVVNFEDITPEDYKIEGILNSIALDESKINQDEFKANETVEKEILYTDRNFIIRGVTFVCNSTSSLSDVNVVIENEATQFRKSTNSDAKGRFVLHLPEQGEYKIYGKKDSYFSQIEKVVASNYNRDKNLYINLEICSEKVNCGKSIRLNNILYDLDEHFLREDARIELNKLAQFLKDNPRVKVELSSHTDSRGSNSYNQRLSQDRANSAVSYIVSQGISQNRIIAKGYGEMQLLNNCSDGVKCSEQQHQLNRRTEFKVICPE